MIARLWTAKLNSAKVPAYADHLKNHVLPILRKVDGYVGAKLLERETADGVELVVITFWQSFDAVKQFAGAAHERAVISEEIIPLLLEYDQGVRHYEVVVDDERAEAVNQAPEPAPPKASNKFSNLVYVTAVRE